MRWLFRLFPKTIAQFHTAFNRDIKVVEENRHTSLRVNSVEQSGEYVEKLFHKAFQSCGAANYKNVRRILVFGIGGGTVIRQLRFLYPKAHITGVDVDRKIVEIAKKYFELEAITNCSFVVDDALAYAATKVPKVLLFDLVVIDVYIGNDVPAFVTQKVFLNNVKKIIRPGGTVMLNYFSYYNQREKSKILLARFSEIYQSVRSLDILRNKFFIGHSLPTPP